MPNILFYALGGFGSRMTGGADATRSLLWPPVNRLFVPAEFGSIRLRNRIVMAPLTRMRANELGVPHPLAAEYYRQRASAGMIVSEGAQISPQGKGYPGTPGIHSSEQIAEWRRVTDAVHDAEGTIVCQLWHVGRISHSQLQTDGGLPVAPSAVRPRGNAWTGSAETPFETPHALSLNEIDAVIEQYAAATRNARAAGFDGVEVHGANGYLIDQFIQDGTNKRQDAYGGTVEKRLTFLSRVLDSVCTAWEAGRVGLRLSPYGTFNDISDADSESTFLAAVDRVSGRGLAYLHLVEPRTSGADSVETPVLGSASKIAKRFDGMTILAGGYNRDEAIRVVQEGLCHAVAFGRLFISNPDLPSRLQRDRQLNAYNRATFYGGGAPGYTDYPSLSDLRGSERGNG
jgi:N-ethylmaleimide reductase